MAVYYITISTLAGLGYAFTEKNKKPCKTTAYLVIAATLLAFLASFRYAIGFDYFAYRGIFEMTASLTFQDILQNYFHEPLFYVISKLLLLAGCSYPVFLLILNVFLLFVWMQFIFRYSKIPWISVYLYVTLQFLAYNMNLLRQSIALAFFLLAYPFLKSRKLAPFAILMVTGGLFHNSLIYMFPLYFLLTHRHSRRFVGLIAALAAFTYIFFDPLFYLLRPVIFTKYASYPASYFWNANGFEYIIPSAVYALLVYLFRNRISDPVNRSVYLNSALYHFLITLFVTKHFILERFAIYPFAFSLIAIPDIIDSFRGQKCGSAKRHSSYHLVMILFLLLSGMYFLFSAYKGFHNVYPYVSLLDKSRSVPQM